MLKPLANLASSLTKPHYSRHDHDHRLTGALVILAVTMGTVLVLLVDWLNTIPNPFAR